MLKLFENDANKRENVVLKKERKIAKLIEKIFLNKDLYNIMIIEFLLDLLFKKIYKEREKVDDKFAKRYSTNDVCVKTNLQFSTLFKKVD